MTSHKESACMAEVHAWREAFFEETRGMSLEEKLACLRSVAQKACAAYGLKPASLPTPGTPTGS